MPTQTQAEMVRFEGKVAKFGSLLSPVIAAGPDPTSEPETSVPIAVNVGDDVYGYLEFDPLLPRNAGNSRTADVAVRLGGLSFDAGNTISILNNYGAAPPGTICDCGPLGPAQPFHRLVLPEPRAVGPLFDEIHFLSPRNSGDVPGEADWHWQTVIHLHGTPSTINSNFLPENNAQWNRFTTRQLVLGFRKFYRDSNDYLRYKDRQIFVEIERFTVVPEPASSSLLIGVLGLATAACRSQTHDFDKTASLKST